MVALFKADLAPSGLIWFWEGVLGFTLYQIALSTQISPRADLAPGGRLGIHHVPNHPLYPNQPSLAKSALLSNLFLLILLDIHSCISTEGCIWEIIPKRGLK